MVQSGSLNMARKLLLSTSVFGTLMVSFSAVCIFSLGIDPMPMLAVLVLVILVSVTGIVPRDRQIQLNRPHAAKFFRGTGRSQRLDGQPPPWEGGISVPLSRPSGGGRKR